MNITFFVTYFLLAVAAVCAETGTELRTSIDRATGLALQGDARSAVQLLARAPAGTGKDAEFRSCMLERFGPTSNQSVSLNADDKWISALGNSYLTYWHRSLTEPKEREAAERELQAQISKLLGHPLSENGLDSAEEEIKSEALKRGFHALLGRTQPLRELMLWRKQTMERRQVGLPEITQSVTVYLLDDFLLRGWGYDATCGRRSAGGWATEDALFAVVPAYQSLEDETFSVRFLAHETQHFADKHAFKNLESWELEFRAKLVELALADSSQDSTLQRICENRGESKESPHAYANSRVVQQVSADLGLAPGELCQRKVLGQALRTAAKRVLLGDSEQRKTASLNTIRIPAGQPVTVDGRAARPEWEDAAIANILVGSDWRVQVRLKHDDEHLYFMFEGLKNGEELLFPEILVDPHGFKSSHWQRGQWWFHVSANLCEGNGEPNVYQKDGVFQCAHEKAGWQANNPPTQQTTIVEIAISFSKIGIKHGGKEHLGLAFGVTDATGNSAQKWYWWPRGTDIERPQTWGEAMLE